MYRFFSYFCYNFVHKFVLQNTQQVIAIHRQQFIAIQSSNDFTVFYILVVCRHGASETNLGLKTPAAVQMYTDIFGQSYFTRRLAVRLCSGQRQ